MISDHINGSERVRGDVGQERGASEEQRVATTTGLRAGLAG